MPADSVLPVTVRRARIVEQVELEGFVRVAELSKHFGISEVTLRSDLDVLARDSVVQRVHGGAVSMKSSEYSTSEQPFETTSFESAAEKRAIGLMAASMVTSGQAIFLDVGTTTTAVATALAERLDLEEVVVVTNALNIALALEAVVPRFTVIITGGTVRPLQHSLVDPLMGTVLDHIRADIAFIGCSGVDESGGVSNINLPEAHVKRRMLASAARAVVVADSTKLGVSYHSRVVPLSEVDELITGANADPIEVERLRQSGLKVSLAVRP
jgi:DeoR family transcriptional regulator of aga operon